MAVETTELRDHQAREGDDADADRVRTAAIEEAPKHKRLLRTARHGRMLSASMLPLFVLRPPSDYALLTTIGRRTGKKRRKRIRAIRRGDRVYVVQLRTPELAMSRPEAVSAWVWNIRAHPWVSLRMRGGTVAGIARELSDPTELEQARQAFCTTVSPFDFGEASMHLRGWPSRRKIEELHRYWFETGIPLVVELEGAG